MAVGPRKSPGSNTPYAGAVARALSLLEHLDGSRRGMNISEMSRKLGIPKSSTHVIVRTLEQLGYIDKQPGSIRYLLGLRAYGLGQGIMKTLALADAALPVMRVLVNELGVPAHLAIADKDQGVFIQKVEAPGLIRFDTYVGRRMDLHCTAVGKIILAFGPEECRERVLSRQAHMRYTAHTITTNRALEREIQKIRKLGYAVDDEEEELGVRCVAAPVVDVCGRFHAALSVTGTISQIRLEEVEWVASRLKAPAATIMRRDAMACAAGQAAIPRSDSESR